MMNNDDFLRAESRRDRGRMPTDSRNRVVERIDRQARQDTAVATIRFVGIQATAEGKAEDKLVAMRDAMAVAALRQV